MAVANPLSYVEASIPPTSDVYVSFVFMVTVMPANGAYATVARFSFSGSTSTLDIAVASSSGLRFSVTAGSSVTLGSVATGVTYRVGLHLHPGNNGGTTIEPKIVEGATSAFGSGSSVIGIGSLGAVQGVAIGVIGPDDVIALFDHVLLDSASMPGP
jgi:hypothetical protein